MAPVGKKQQSHPAFINRLRKALCDKLATVKVDAEVSVERIDKTELFRVSVVSSKFAKLRHSERQNLVWRIADEVIPNNKLQVTMILTLTPSERNGIDA